MSKRILIISDLLGFSCNTSGHKFFKNKEVYNLQSITLAKIDIYQVSKEDIHDQFLNGGIDIAVNEILKQKDKKIDCAIGFSIGGLILWKAVLKGLNVDNLVCISTTRLRYEKIKPKCNILLFNGENDLYTPSIEWAEKMGIPMIEYKNEDHEFYKNEEKFKYILKNISNI